jgi:Recombinase zinc beta ribbon domain
MEADPHELITVEIPEWRIVDDATWFAVSEKFAERGPQVRSKRIAKYALTGLARCSVCKGTIAASRPMAFGGSNERKMTYACARHHQRGASVCPVTIHQPMDEIEGAIIDHLQAHVLTDAVLEVVIAEMREQMERELKRNDDEIEALEAELRVARTEQKRVAKTVALADDIPELVTELRQRLARIQQLEAQLAAARRTPDEVANLIDLVAERARIRLAAARARLNARSDIRELFLGLFPEGLEFIPARSPDGSRQIWRVRPASYGSIMNGGPLQSTTRPQRDSKTTDASPRSEEKQRLHTICAVAASRGPSNPRPSLPGSHSWATLGQHNSAFRFHANPLAALRLHSCRLL